MLWSPIYLIFNLTSPLLCFVEVAQDHLCRDLIFIKNSSNWKSQHFKGSAVNAHNPHCPASWRETDTNCQVHVRKCSAFHIPGTARGGRAAKKGTQVRPSSNANCKNNSSDCNQLAVSLQHSLKSLGQPARQSSSQEEGADRKPWCGNTAFQAQNQDGDLPCSASLELHLHVLICAMLHFSSQEVLLTWESTNKCVSGWWTYPPLYNLNFRSKSGVHHPEICSKYRKKAYMSCRLHSAHGGSWKVTTSPLLTSTK